MGKLGGAEESHFDLASLRNPKGDAGEAAGCVRLETMGESYAGERNLGGSSTEVACSNMALVEITKGMSNRWRREEDPGLSPKPLSISSQRAEEG